MEEEVETGIQNGSDSETKISDEENDYLKGIYYNPRSPVAFSGFHKMYKFIKNEGKDIKPKKTKGLVKQAGSIYIPFIQLEENFRDLGCWLSPKIINGTQIQQI